MRSKDRIVSDNLPSNDKTTICSLCLQKQDLRASHVIPRFVGKWLKASSATGFMKGVEDSEDRIQDFPTLPLLCSSCEERFSKLETYFANQIFYPFHDRKVRQFDYDQRLSAFVVSLSWRTLKTSYEEMKGEVPHLVSYVDRAESEWRDYLLRESHGTVSYQNHLFFMPTKYRGASPVKFEWYALRAVDTTLAGNANRIFAFTKLPWMVIVSTIQPSVIEGWEGTEVKQEGRISDQQVVRDDEFWEFLASRAAFIDGSPEPSPKRIERVIRGMSEDPWRYLESDSFETMILETDRLREEKMKQIPENVRELVSVITEALEDPTKAKRENRLDILRSRTVADAIANLASNDSLELDKRIQSTIEHSARQDRDGVMTFQSDHIWLTFMANPHSTKNEQRTKIEEEANRLRTLRGSKKMPIAVFSMRLSQNGVNFETALIPS